MNGVARRACWGALLALCGLGWGGAALAAPTDKLPHLAGYSTFGEMEGRIEKLKTRPGVRVEALATTRGGRKVYAITLGLEAANRPALLVVGNTEAPFLLGSELALQTAELFAARADDERVKQFLSRFTLYVVPRPDPDGTEKNLALKPVRAYAGNATPTDDDRDFKQGEDAPDDLNGDGLITQMRVADDAGTHRPHPDEPRVLVPVDRGKNERGAYRVYIEGQDDDLDEQFNEDAGDGVSLDRNFPYRFPYYEAAAGPYAASEVETRALIDFVCDRPAIAAVLSFATDDNLMHPWKPGQAETGKLKTTMPAGDGPYHALLAEKYQKLHGGKDCPAPASGNGSFAHWVYYHHGRWSLAARGWWVPKIALDEEAKKKLSGDTRGEEELNALRWLAQQKREDQFLAWQKVEHPQFPGQTVEVGGFVPQVRLCPPASEAASLAEKHFEYLLEVASLLPRLELRKAKVEPLGEGVYRVSTTAVNTGSLPSMSHMGRTAESVPPLQMALEFAEGVTFLTGTPRTQFEPLEGQGGQREFTWLVRVAEKKPRSGSLRVWAPSVGEVKIAIELP